MKYLRSYLLVPRAGGQILGSRAVNRQLRCLTTSRRHCKVTYSCKYWRQKRLVSTDGAKKSQLATALPPPNGSDIEHYKSVQRRSGGNRRENDSLPVVSCSYGIPSLPIRTKPLSEPFSYGQFLSGSNSVKRSQDPISLEMAFLPSFHACRQNIKEVFFPKRSKSAVDADIRASVTKTTAKMKVERPTSLLELLPSTETPEDSGSSDRRVAREIFLPRTNDPTFIMIPQSSFDTFLEVHNFQKKSNTGEEKNEDISPFPKRGDPLNVPANSFVIQNDRSSVIIHSDLYITNRILEKLKKIEDKPLDNLEPTIRTAGQSIMLEQCDSVGLTENAESAAAEHSVTITNSPGDCPPIEDSKSYLQASDFSNQLATEVLSDLQPLSSSSTSPPTRTLESTPPNIEFGMSSNNLRALESVALQSRKNLYAQMKSLSSPCVLVDGVHVKHTQCKGFPPGLGKKNSALTVGQPVKTIDSDRRHPSDVKYLDTSCCSTLTVPPLRNTNSSPQVTSTGNSRDSNSNPENIPHLSVPHNYLSHASPFPEFTQSDTHNYDQQALREWDSNKLQSELEDWFIPLGKEIESMLITLETSKNCVHVPSDCEASNLMFEEIPDVFETNETSILMKEESSSLDGVVEMKKVGLNPGGHQPFESRQCRDNSSSAGLPTKPRNPHVDVKTETIIKCSRSGDNTDINVTETQRYLDKRLPYPFCTETVLQVYGTNDSLSKASQAVENSKSQIVHLSNANAPNPGMLTPKLQFNHMLSKSHDNFKPNSKKTVLKIKVVPNPDTASQSEPKPSHFLQLTEQPAEISTDVSKLIKKSKFVGPKKGSRRSSMMKLRPKKKLHRESSEKVKILSPQDLEKMFPSPPKPKPVVKPRKVTVETKKGKESPVEIVSQTQSSFMAAPRSRKAEDEILLKVPRSTDTKVVSQSEVPVAQSDKLGQIPKGSNVDLSTRDQNILKSIISHKVKDSFMAVTKKVDVTPKVSKEVLKHSTHPSPNGHSESKPNEINDLMKSIKRTRPKSPFLPKEKNGVDKSHEVEHSVPKTVDATILRASKNEQAKEKKPVSVPRPKSAKVDNPTPLPNREYVEIRKGPTKSAAATQEAGKKNKIDDVRPPSASTIIANVMRNSGDAQSEARWSHLDKETVPDVIPNRDVPMKSNVQPRPLSAQPGKLQSEVKPDVKNEGTSLNEQRKDIQADIRTMNAKEYDVFKNKKVWNHLSEPLFFPFETPNYKEMLQEPPQESHPIHPIPREVVPKPSAEPDAVYEADFCKLCTENVPRLAESAPGRYRVPLNRMKNFPLVNPGKPKSYIVPSSGAMSINPLHDLMLRRNLTQVPAVTKILGATLSAKSQQALDRWKEGLISTLGEQGFQEFYQSQLKRGTDFHSAVRKLLVGHPDNQDDLCMRSLSSVLPSVSEVSVVESQVVHPLLGYRGVIDCVAKYKGKPVVIEWKRSDKSKPSLKHTYDAPLQLCAYFGAINFDNNYKAQQVEGGVVVVAYSDGSPSDVYELSIEECGRYWAKWLKRLHQYYSHVTGA